MGPKQWAQWWVTALRRAPCFTWMFVQDHRGGQESPQRIAAYFRALAPAIASLNSSSGGSSARIGKGNRSGSAAPSAPAAPASPKPAGGAGAGGVRFWANAELFHIVANTAALGGEGNATRTQGSIDRVHRQLMEEAPHVGGFTAWEWYWNLSPRGGVQQHRASRSDALHSGSLTLYRNYQRTVLEPGVALLLVTAGHGYRLLTPPTEGGGRQHC